ncbi:glutathione synthetase [Luteococcus sp. Sow4_B9]|uniref:glutathione synthetase n=1 Tax=Luteococcus sp. Sow4_B9 TaxID=3438792 RepID=UPI003F95A38C
MKIGFVVNDIATEQAGYTTTRLALTASQMGHEVGLIGLGDFNYLPDGSLGALVHSSSDKTYRSHKRYLDDLKKDEGRQTALGDFDVIMLRSDPASDPERPWASTAGVAFGQLIASTGVLVVNDPETLATAMSKAYFQHFPEIVRPKTLISRDEGQIATFVKDLGGQAVLKPLQGSGGSGVFLVTKEESPNLNQIIEAIARDGYVVAQEYLPAAAEGDTRLFVMDGKPLKVDGKYAAFRRVNESSDMRSNVSAGGHIREAEITGEMLKMVEVIRPKLVSDGMFLVGLDIVGDKLMEINVFTPGGLGSSQNIYDVDFTPKVIGALERKVAMQAHYPQGLPNKTLAAM